MTYDATAKAVGIKAIGTVESSFDYTAINYNDPITVGVAQWYGTRAASLLRRMRTAGQGAVHFDVSGATNIASKWRSAGGSGVISQASDGVSITQNSSTANPYIEPSSNTVFTGKKVFEFTAEVSVSVNLRVRAWVYPGTGATGPVVPAWTQLTPAMGKQILTFKGEYEATNSFVRFIIYVAGATATISPMGAAFTVHSAKAITVGSWGGVEATVESSLDAHDDNDQWWNSRYLTKAEGESLKPVLNANKAIQNAVMIEDMEDYKNEAVKMFIDPDANTQMMLLWFTAYHQSPLRARRIIANLGADSSIDRLLAGILNEPVFGQYKTRYNTAYKIITTGDSSGVDTPPDSGVPVPEPGGSPSDDTPSVGTNRPTGDIDHLSIVGDAVHVTMKNDSVVVAVQSPGGLYLPGIDASAGSPVPPPTQEQPPTDPPVPDPGSGGPDVNLATRQAVVQFVVDRINRYKYAQAPGRREPDKSGFTDCSGLVGYAYRTVAGIDPGNATFDQLTTGTRITEGSGSIDESLLKLGDLVLFDWNGGRANVDHVEMYTGPNQLTGHGGPGIGPTQKNLQNMVGRAKRWYVNRYV